MLAFLRSIAAPVLKQVIKMAGNSVGMGFPVGDIAVESWDAYWKRKTEKEAKAEIAHWFAESEVFSYETVHEKYTQTKK